MPAHHPTRLRASCLLLLALALVPRGLLAAMPDAAWAASLQPGQTVQLPAGNYRGPWTIGPRVHLIASPGATLEGGETTLTIRGNGVTVEGLLVRASPRGVGIAAEDAFGVALLEVHVVGGTRGIVMHRGSLSLRGGGVAHTSQFGVWLQGCDATISSLELADHRGSALYLAHTRARIDHLHITRTEYGLLAFHSRFELKASRIAETSRTGAGVILSSGSIEETLFDGPFSEAALSISGAHPLRIRGNRIVRAGSIGIKLLNSTASLSQNLISGARSDAQGLEGDGLYANNSQIDSDGDRILDNGGAAVSVMGGRAAIRGCMIQGAGQAAAAVASQGVLTLSGCEISNGSTDLVATPGATISRSETP